MNHLLCIQLGISLGGMVSWFFAATEERVKVVVPFIGVHFFQHAIENELFRPRVETIRAIFQQAA